MALTDQTFPNKPIIVVGSSFFLNAENHPSYELALQMRENETLRVAYDFHFCDMERPRGGGTFTNDPQKVFDAVSGWGAPVVMGKIFPETISKESVREFQRLLVSCLKIHSTYLCKHYRYLGPRNLSTYTGEQLLVALSLAAQDPEPSSLSKYLIGIANYI